MWNWCRAVSRDIHALLAYVCLVPRRRLRATPTHDRRFLALGLSFAGILVFLALAVVANLSYDATFPQPPSPEPETDESWKLFVPIREEPDRFPANTYLPRKREGLASGSIKLHLFDAEIDLVSVYDDRVWWESEHDRNDTEDDHRMHHTVEEPFRRLVELVDQHNALLKVQDAYRAEGIHAVRSLHKEGRALDLTAEGISLEKLAKLCWAAGFDWVYYEAPRDGGAHIHCSVRTYLR